MRKLALSFFVLLCLPGLAHADFTLIYGAGMPEIANSEKGGLPALAELVNESRIAGNTVFIFGGASLGPSMLGSLDRGSHIIDILNTMEPTAMQVSKREFIFREDELSMRAAESFFPLLLSNVHDPGTDGDMTNLESALTVYADDITLGLMAMLGEEVMSAYPPDHISLKNPLEQTKLLGGQLQDEGADYLLVFTDFVWPEAESVLRQGLVDVIICNDANENSITQVDKGVLINLSTDGASALKMDFPSMRAEFVALSEIPQDGIVKNKVDEYLAQMEKILNVELGLTDTAFDTLRANVRSGENAFGNIVADAIRKELNSDAALINGGIIRGNRAYEAGTILSRRDLRGEIPFQDEIALITVTGQQLWDALENGLSRIDELSGRFPHVSGMQVAYTPGNPAGSRVISVEIKGAPLDLQKTYTLGTSVYLAGGGDEYFMFRDAVQMPAQALMLSDVVRLYIAKEASISPAVDGRMVAMP